MFATEPANPVCPILSHCNIISYKNKERSNRFTFVEISTECQLGGLFFMQYHIFKKSIQSKGKTVHRWYYYYIHPETGKKIQKVCKNCKTNAEANVYVSNLPEFIELSKLTVKEISKDMFLPNGEYIKRMEALGKTFSMKTVLQNRHYIELINEELGDIELEKITVQQVMNYLIAMEMRSGSWKNSYLQTFSKIYDEAAWKSNKVIPKPNFPSFNRNSKKADFLTQNEIISFFSQSNFDLYRDYLFFLTVYACGLRIGEGRALRPCHFIFEKNAVVIDGFCKKNGDRTNYNKKGNNEDTKLRVVIISSKIGIELQNYIKGNHIKDDDFIFNRGLYNPVRQEYLETIFQKAIKRAGIEKDSRKLVPHSLRFTYVTRMRRNLEAETVQKMVGHSSVEMTEYYTRVAIPEMIEGLKSAHGAADMLFD